MKLRKLARLCEHDKLEPHLTWMRPEDGPDGDCPGGVFLTNDALVIEQVDGEWPDWAQQGWWGNSPDQLDALQKLSFAARSREVPKEVGL